jgi:Protein of unknown function (Hypoth_ymh)
MAHPLREALPDPEVLLSLAPEELAGVLLQILKAGDQQLGGYEFVSDLRQREVYPRAFLDRVGKAIMEAWTWMIAFGLLAPDPRQNMGDWVFLTRRAGGISDSDAFEAFRKASILPRTLLHPVIAERAWPNFIRGDHDTAVFQAFKEVEVAVRKAGGFDPEKFGVALMRAAFDPDTGPLSDKGLPKGERDSLPTSSPGLSAPTRTQAAIAQS